MGSRFKEVKKLSSWRKIALHTWRDVGDPTVYGSMEIDATNALAYVKALREKTGLHVTITHVVAKAVAQAIAKCPDINGIVLGTKLLMRESVDVFLLVAIDEGSDLSGAKIQHADRKSVSDIARELVERQKRLRAHKDKEVEPTQYLLKLLPDFMIGPMLGLISKLSYDWDIDLHKLGVPYDQFGSAIVTSFGMFGLGLGLAPLVPFAHTTLLISVGEVRDKAVVVDGQIVVRPMLTVGATFDHRLIDGFQASVLAKAGREIIEDPAKHLGGP